MQRNSRPGKGHSEKNQSGPKRGTSRAGAKPSSPARKYNKPAGAGKRGADAGSEDSERPVRRTGGFGAPGQDRPRRAYNKSSEGEDRPRRTYNKSSEGEDRPRRAYNKSSEGDDRPRRTYNKSSEGEDRPRRTFNKSSEGEDRPRRTFNKSSEGEDRPRRTFNKSSEGEDRPRRTFNKSSEGEDRPRRAYNKSSEGEDRPRRTYNKSSEGEDRPRRTYHKSSEGEDRPRRKFSNPREERAKKFAKDADGRRSFDRKPKPGAPSGDGLIRLNKYLANAGIASRREADELIKAGAVMVNGVIVSELGTKISPSDKVQYGQQTIRKEKLVYVLLNKPKGYITTTDDPFDRNTVMALVADAGRERIYPVGRLDRNTSGLLLFTNDGELAKKLTHPSHKVRKVYHVELDKPLTKTDLLKIGEGVELEDGMAFIDEISYAEEGKSKREVGIELHSGRNRIVRRIFEALGYEVQKLDRVVFAGLTKKDLPRGRWRFLTDKEVSYLQMIR